MTNLNDNLLNYILTELLIKKVIKCTDVLDGLDGITDEVKEKFCSRDEFKKWDKYSINKIIYICEYQESSYWRDLINTTEITNIQLL